jgi:hypothetical protein
MHTGAEPEARGEYTRAFDEAAHVQGNSLVIRMVPLFAVPFMMYLFAASRRAYGDSWWRTAFKTLLLSAWTLAVLTAYRFILFFTTFYAT